MRISDWSSAVCSSDLQRGRLAKAARLLRTDKAGRSLFEEGVDTLAQVAGRDELREVSGLHRQSLVDAHVESLGDAHEAGEDGGGRLNRKGTRLNYSLKCESRMHTTDGKENNYNEIKKATIKEQN